ncbi:hypothetical protein CHLNCDRAFT_145418 [Chlorella variabilis]|uniref:Dethiobiotin synthase n=1 Tax=Chlorella variabilis TaxID=554065 RepID=E1ZED9_CHLVA|nr:hypothetical protein CHLNCDRAFT_145418 [Chlorella variabilis]EFN56014.1 hypothetical protein CHLNCDRAFT_145418 [Chlorella variabilis]|eukprot:XP_005848116.1 hypothetical protein CHLNCDRAFT_145418 [Chlorella variabilis]
MLLRAVLLLGRRSGGGGGGSGGRRLLSTASQEEELGSIPLSFPAVCIWGSNTGVGKTLFSAGLAAAGRRDGLPVLYLKPAQTGFPADSDARLVAAAADLPLVAGPHAAQLDSQLQAVAGPGGGAQSMGTLAKTLYAWGQPISPHLAVETEGRPISDRQVAADVAAELRAFAAAGSSSVRAGGAVKLAICDLLRALRLPGVLVGDGRLGGISATLSAYDSLALRGHQVPLVVLMDDGRLDNARAIQRHLGSKASVLAFPVCQPPPAASSSQQAAAASGGVDAELAAWLSTSRPQFDALLAAAGDAHQRRLDGLHSAAGDARSMLWWPFTQHTSVSGVTVIDGRVGESFSVFTPAPAAEPGAEAGEAAAAHSGAAGSGSLELLYDSCASWWTQGVSQQAQPELVRAVSAAAARYGHVMFPENAHEPAVELARQMLGSVGGGWATRVFYSDNGSTAIEVALKMAFRKYMVDRGLLVASGSEGGEADGGTAVVAAAEEEEAGPPDVELQVVGLREAYHGDTLGAMEAVAPSPFNGRLQTPWYSGRGLFLDPPTAALVRGVWRVQLPAGMREAAGAAERQQWQTEFGSQAGVFDLERRMGDPGRYAPLYAAYRRHIEQQLHADRDAGPGAGSRQTAAAQQQEQEQEERGGSSWQAGRARQLGACILEPVLQGAGGMRLIDPLFQRALVDSPASCWQDCLALAAALGPCPQRRIPVIYDEVFTGFWRLGSLSGAALLGAPPDIACYAKLLTGGLVPLAATLATREVFAAFEGDRKVQALLHGHSYTAHPVGCAAGVASLQLYRDPSLNPNWCTPGAPGRCQNQEEGGGGGCQGPCGRMLPLWDEAAVAALSSHPGVAAVVPLGTVLAVQLQAEDGGGYASGAAAAVVARLRRRGVYGRPLGDVVYLMVTPMTERRQCDALLAKLAAALG